MLIKTWCQGIRILFIRISRNRTTAGTKCDPWITTTLQVEMGTDFWNLMLFVNSRSAATLNHGTQYMMFEVSTRGKAWAYIKIPVFHNLLLTIFWGQNSQTICFYCTISKPDPMKSETIAIKVKSSAQKLRYSGHVLKKMNRKATKLIVRQITAKNLIAYMTMNETLDRATVL